LQPARRNTVVAAPVVGKLEQVFARLEAKGRLQPRGQTRVAVDFPQTGDDMIVRNQARRRDSGTKIIQFRIVDGAVKASVLILSPPHLIARQIAPRELPQISLPSFARTLPLMPGRMTTTSGKGMTIPPELF
jgi:hypothetical protein